MSTIITEYTANHSVSKALAILGVKHTETRLNDDQVQFDVDLTVEDATMVIEMALTE